MRSGWTVMISACMLAALTACASAQNGRPSPRSSKIGVYTEAQAARGEETFAGICQSCHTKTEYTRATFSSKWGGRPLWELYFNISTMMPQNDPGSLTPQEYAQVLAFILKQNGMPAGREELPADSVVLKTILFDTVSAQPGHTRNRLN